MTHICKAEQIERIRVSGDCLEAIGVPNGGIAIIDCNADANEGDVVWCNNWRGVLGGFIKQVVKLGKDIIVGTAYKDEARNFTFEASEIYGVVTHILDGAGSVTWERTGSAAKRSPALHTTRRDLQNSSTRSI